jgi:serine/threonine-protein kinase
MALAPLISFALLLDSPGAEPVLQELLKVEPAGTNALILLIGAGLAIYGAHVLNSLRAQLHEASRYGNYQLRRKLGVGGMGEVYLAEHQLLKRPCALKLIRPESVNDPVALARFEREVQSAARLSHPNTIEIFDYGHTDDGTFYYVMEYLPGMSFSELVKTYAPLPPGRVIYLLRQACAGLAEAHALGLIHRDLKPANIFIAVRGGEYDVVKVLDFGLVKVTLDPNLPELTGAQTVSGTPSFMAPEQATGDRGLDARADVYALGAIAYYALTGRPPFVGESGVAIMISHARDPVVPPSKLRADIPADLEQVVLRCLAKKPEDRYASVTELAKALAACEAAADWDADRARQWWSGVLQETEASPGVDVPVAT